MCRTSDVTGKERHKEKDKKKDKKKKKKEKGKEKDEKHRHDKVSAFSFP